MPRGGGGRGYTFCNGVNADGSGCGNRVPTLPSGIVVRRRCAVHARQTYDEARARRERAAKLASNPPPPQEA